MENNKSENDEMEIDLSLKLDSREEEIEPLNEENQSSELVNAKTQGKDQELSKAETSGSSKTEEVHISSIFSFVNSHIFLHEVVVS